MSGSNTSKYLKYAFGEIILVVVGILLALQINNWNESRKSKDELTNILTTVAKDLERDTLVAKSIITIYDSIKATSQLLINRKINLDNYKKYPRVKSLASIYIPFSVQQKGYEMLKKYTNQNDSKNDTLVGQILQFYTPLLQIINDNNQFIKKEVLENIDDFKKQGWFVDWTQQKTTPEMISYFVESEDYRKKVASNLIFAIDNHKKTIDAYKRNANFLIKEIHKKIK